MWQVNTRLPSAPPHHALPAPTWAQNKGPVLETTFDQTLFVPKATDFIHSHHENLSQHGTGKGDKTLVAIHLPAI